MVGTQQLHQGEPLWRLCFVRTRDDWRAWDLRRRDVTGRLLIASLTVPAALGFALGNFRERIWLLDNLPQGGWLEQGLVAAVVVVVWFLALAIWQTVQARRALARRPPEVCVTVEIDDNEVRESCGGAAHRVAWRDVADVMHGADLVIVHDGLNQPILVPARAFAHRATFKSFVAFVEARVAVARS